MSTLNQTVQAQGKALDLLRREFQELSNVVKSELGLSAGPRMLTPFEKLADSVRKLAQQYEQLEKSRAQVAKHLADCKLDEKQLAVIVKALQVLNFFSEFQNLISHVFCSL